MVIAINLANYMIYEMTTYIYASHINKNVTTHSMTHYLETLVQDERKVQGQITKAVDHYR